MGSPEYEPERNSHKTQHKVTVSSFYMGIYPVTQAEYEKIMGINPSHFKGSNLPVEKVAWFDAIEYCNRRSVREGLTPAYVIGDSWKNVNWNRNANGYRLPTEAEWEYACRAGTTTPFSTGNNITTSQANYRGEYPYNNNPKGEYRGKTTPVGSFKANPWGLYDMHGNVEEWCWDKYAPYPSEAQIDPMGPSSEKMVYVLRGGSWYAGGELVRSAYRDLEYGPSRSNTFGFRVVLSASINTTYKTTHRVLENLRLREAADTNSKVVTTLPKDTEVQVLETGSTATINGITAPWVKVVSNSGYTGWCFSGYLEDIKGQSPAISVNGND